MGSNTSKSSMQSTMSKVSEDEIETILVLLDPRSPDMNRTPLTSILGNREKHMEQIPTTPVNYLRKSVLNSSNEKKLLDPRSPSQFIPRTPLNMSFNANEIETSAGQYSLEYSGCIEEASCRNFNERLANITFDDSYTELINNNASKSPEKLVPQVPLQINAPKSQFDVNVYTDGENISPAVDSTQSNKRNALLFSSTPMLTNQQKSLLFAVSSNKEIFADDQIKNVTPVKRLTKIREPRTPFGCLQNHQQLIAKDIEHMTPKTKPTANAKRTNKPRNEIICD